MSGEAVRSSGWSEAQRGAGRGGGCWCERRGAERKGRRLCAEWCGAVRCGVVRGTEVAVRFGKRGGKGKEMVRLPRREEVKGLFC
jgi:hypothetical protein